MVASVYPMAKLTAMGLIFVAHIVALVVLVAKSGAAVIGAAVAKSWVVMIHCVWSLEGKMCYNTIAICSITTFYHNGLF